MVVAVVGVGGCCQDNLLTYYTMLHMRFEKENCFGLKARGLVHAALNVLHAQVSAPN